MYEKHFGLSAKPFEVAPDPKFLYLNSTYKEILSSLIYGVNERKGLIAVVGEVGTGKTLMLNCLKKNLAENVRVAMIVNPGLTPLQMLQMVSWDLGIAEEGESLSKPKCIQRLKKFAEEQVSWGGNVLLLIDEAQNISTEGMENLRLLSNIETEKTKLIQMVVSGQEELEEKLLDKNWRSFVQRISLKRNSIKFTEEETYNYINHRLSIAGRKDDGIFDLSAKKLVWHYSEGIPRKINIICDNALLIAYGIDTKKISPKIIREVANDLGLKLSDGLNLATEDDNEFNDQSGMPTKQEKSDSAKSIKRIVDFSKRIALRIWSPFVGVAFVYIILIGSALALWLKQWNK